MGGELRRKRIKGEAGGFQFFSPRGMRRSGPTLVHSPKILRKSGVKAGFGGGKGHFQKIEWCFRGVECLSRRGQRFSNNRWQM